MMFTLEQLAGKTVLLRADFNVPMRGRVVKNVAKLQATLPTITFLRKQGCKIVICSHLGRPNGLVDLEHSLQPVAHELQKLLDERVYFNPDCIGASTREGIKQIKPGGVLLLENLRFHKEEEEDEPVFAQSLAALADYAVIDAFGVAYRKHASMHAMLQYIPSCAGLLLQKEVLELQKALKPKRPAVWLMGGAKLSKIDLIQQALESADTLLVGGALAFSFLRAQGKSVGVSKIDRHTVTVARALLKQRQSKKIILPLDFVSVTEMKKTAKTTIVPANQIPSDHMCLDIGPATIASWKQTVRGAHTVVWNGPLGYYEWAPFAVGTRELARTISMLTATTLCGGGETADAVQKFGLAQKFTHVSSGGSASLAFLSGQKPLVLSALEKNYKTFAKRIKQSS